MKAHGDYRSCFLKDVWGFLIPAVLKEDQDNEHRQAHVRKKYSVQSRMSLFLSLAIAQTTGTVYSYLCKFLIFFWLKRMTTAGCLVGGMKCSSSSHSLVFCLVCGME